MCSLSQAGQSSISIFICLILFIGMVAALFSSHHATQTAECNLPVIECPNAVKGLDIESVMIPGCCEWPCSLHRGKNFSVIIGFHTNDNYTNVLQKICYDPECDKAVHPLPDYTDVCKSLITCPLEAGRNYQITEKLHIANDAPIIRGLFSVIFIGWNNATAPSYRMTGDMIGCLKVNFSIVS